MTAYAFSLPPWSVSANQLGKGGTARGYTDGVCWAGLCSQGSQQDSGVCLKR